MEIALVQGDITQFAAEALVNAANTGLWGGGGVDGAIHRVGGPAIMQACNSIRARQGGITTGEAVETTAGKLPANYVLHTAGPVWKGGTEQEEVLLARCYINCLKLAEALGCASIAFPNISTGVYGFPKAQAAEIAVNEVQRFNSDKLKRATFVCFDEENYRLYQQLLNG